MHSCDLGLLSVNDKTAYTIPVALDDRIKAEVFSSL